MTNEKWIGVPHTAAPCSVPGLTQFYDHLLAAAKENPEHVGYADFPTEGRRRGVEMYCDTSSVRALYSCPSIDQKVARVDRDALTQLLEDLATNQEIDDLRTTWQIRFYSPELVPEALFRILRRLCGCTDGAPLEIHQWWT